MKTFKSILTFLVLFILAFKVEAQNIHDPYIFVDGELAINYPTNISMSANISGAYVGEYQFYLPNDHSWSKLTGVQFRVKTECVSFPFVPIHQYHGETFNSLPIRKLGVPSSNDLIKEKEQHWDFIDYYNPGNDPNDWTFTSIVAGTDNKIYLNYDGEEWYSGTGNAVFLTDWGTPNTDANSLLSVMFYMPNGNASIGGRKKFPHSVLKHVLFVADNQGNLIVH